MAQQASSYQIKESDILVTMTGTRGKGDYFFTVHITDSVLNGKKIFINQRVGCLRTNSLISSKWLCFTLQSNFIREAIFEHETGTANQGNIGSEDIKKILLPLPPLAVQNAIVAKLEQVLPLVDAYENAILQKEELKSALPDKIKKAILQEAITGKLTESWRKSATIKQNGKQLLDQIIEERNAKALAEWEEALKKNVGGKATLSSFASKTRAKKPVPVVASEIDEEKIPFEVPESWCWCRLNLVCWLDDAEKKEGEYINLDAKYLRGKSHGEVLKTGRFVKENEKIILVDGENSGEVFIVPHEGYMGSTFKRLCLIDNIEESYLNLFLSFKKDVFRNNKKGAAIPHLDKSLFREMLFPLPPLEEQAEIVKKVEELLPLCK